jgi:molybdopterin molybdotransferase
MPEFLELLPPAKALNKLLMHLLISPEPETINTKIALGRIVFSPVNALHPLPEFPRSTVDGYAVMASDTFGANESLPAYLRLIGEIPMGKSSGMDLKTGECILIHTGGMMPEGADAVVMVEYTQHSQENEVEILRAVGVGENVIRVGEDIMIGDEVISKGARLRPAEIGGLMAIGCTQVEVARRPVVGIISSGDEVISPELRPKPGQVRDINAYTLGTLVQEAGGDPVFFGIIPDDQSAMVKAAVRAKESCDIVVITAGSSASTRDLTSIVIDQLGKPGVLVHGVNVRPGKPTILAVCDNVAMIGLPGNPVSALVIAGLFVVPVIKEILGERVSRPQGVVSAQLTVNLSSQAGREDWIPVRLYGVKNGFQADPIFGRSNLIFTLVRADGLIRIQADSTGLMAGSDVDVFVM